MNRFFYIIILLVCSWTSKAQENNDSVMTLDKANEIMLSLSDETEKKLDFYFYALLNSDAILLKDSLMNTEMYSSLKIVEYKKDLWGVNGETLEKIKMEKATIDNWILEIDSIGDYFNCDFGGWGQLTKK
tara:strand:+ start:462 stop:851 length:390 start_codon:yes stop_codon:yes gene_type:complete